MIASLLLAGLEVATCGGADFWVKKNTQQNFFGEDGGSYSLD